MNSKRISGIQKPTQSNPQGGVATKGTKSGVPATPPKNPAPQP